MNHDELPAIANTDLATATGGTLPDPPRHPTGGANGGANGRTLGGGVNGHTSNGSIRGEAHHPIGGGVAHPPLHPRNRR